MGGWPSGKFTCNRPGGSHEEALYHRRSVLGHDLGLCRQRMRSRFAALELQLVALGLRFSTPTVQLGGVELRFERGAPVLELRFVALERQLVILELRFATFEFWFTTPKKRACFRPGSGRLRDWTRFGVPPDFGPAGRSIWRSPRGDSRSTNPAPIRALHRDVVQEFRSQRDALGKAACRYPVYRAFTPAFGSLRQRAGGGLAPFPLASR